MSVVTITRQYGAGGSAVARHVAESLGWTLIDNDFIQQVATRAHLPVATVAAQEERVPSLMQRLVRTLASASPEAFVPAGGPGPAETAVATEDEPAEEQIVRVTERVIGEAAQHGRVVLVGRGAQAVLTGWGPDTALHVYVIAPRELRVRTVMQRLGVREREAGQTTDATDADRDRYVQRWYRRRRQDPANYHMVLNTGWLGYDGAAALVVAAAKSRGWS
ncbi:MAG: AAA family ATPase [Gemmatimonadales bacterium]